MMRQRGDRSGGARLRAALFTIVAAGVASSAALADPPLLPSICAPDATHDGAVYRICMPGMTPWNGDLVIWAHGYVEAQRPVAIPEEQLCLGGGFCIPEITNALGFGFITTSYRMNGLVTTGVEDVVELVDLFTAAHGAPRRVYLVGA